MEYELKSTVVDMRGLVQANSINPEQWVCVFDDSLRFSKRLWAQVYAETSINIYLLCIVYPSSFKPCLAICNIVDGSDAASDCEEIESEKLHFWGNNMEMLRRGRGLWKLVTGTEAGAVGQPDRGDLLKRDQAI